MEIKNKNILFLGVGGVSMHQLALAFKSMGAKVFGYDKQENLYTKKCKDCGILVEKKLSKVNLNVDLCIKTAAIKNDNKIVEKLKANNVEILDRAIALSFLCKQFKNVIAVAGTHGKSTTAALIYHILKVAGKKVSCHIGADILNAGFNLKDDYFVVEACEYNKSFLSLYPTLSVVTNIEREHMDSYKSFFNLKNAFTTFLKRGKDRFVFLEKSTQFLTKHKNINFVNVDNSLHPKIKGEYNLKNVSMAASVARHLGIDERTIQKGIKSFAGIPRRFEYLGEKNNTKFYIDYAHHPTEVKEFVSAFLHDNKNSKIVFQPHTYSRTKMLLKDFLEVFKNLDNLIIYKEYPARETKDKGLSAKQLYNEVKLINPNVLYVEKVKDLNSHLRKISAVAFVGAGDINAVAKKIIKSN